LYQRRPGGITEIHGETRHYSGRRGPTHSRTIGHRQQQSPRPPAATKTRCCARSGGSSASPGRKNKGIRGVFREEHVTPLPGRVCGSVRGLAIGFGYWRRRFNSPAYTSRAHYPEVGKGRSPTPLFRRKIRLRVNTRRGWRITSPAGNNKAKEKARIRCCGY